ncbi:MAG: chromate resistance protein ChrB domain-containing protein [Caldimonas sp.]
MKSTAAWLLLILSLPTGSATGRMRIWRALKARGCVALRDGAYLLPASTPHDEALRELADECVQEGGSAWVLPISPVPSHEQRELVVLFDRGDDYRALMRTWRKAVATLSSLGSGELTRLRTRLARDHDALRAIDFFPGEASVEAEVAWSELHARLERMLAPDEPQASHGNVPRLDRNDYQARIWATRRRLWVDRVASAWLIQRYIDPSARFQWLARPSDCPRKVLGFDFDGARFSHVGERVTFEVLMASFGLEDDPALMRLAAMVHALDTGGASVPEAAGFEAVLAGTRARAADDDTLLAEMTPVLDALYLHFQRDGAGGTPR